MHLNLSLTVGDGLCTATPSRVGLQYAAGRANCHGVRCASIARGEPVGEVRDVMRNGLDHAVREIIPCHSTAALRQQLKSLLAMPPMMGLCRM